MNADNSRMVIVELSATDIQNLMSALRNEISRIWKEPGSDSRRDWEPIEKLVCLRHYLSRVWEEMRNEDERFVNWGASPEDLELSLPLVEREIVEMKKESSIDYFENMVRLKVVLRDSLELSREEE